MVPRNSSIKKKTIQDTSYSGWTVLLIVPITTHPIDKKTHVFQHFRFCLVVFFPASLLLSSQPNSWEVLPSTSFWTCRGHRCPPSSPARVWLRSTEVSSTQNTGSFEDIGSRSPANREYISTRKVLQEYLLAPIYSHQELMTDGSPEKEELRNIAAKPKFDGIPPIRA